eukprot:241141-Chlamydomonas_euryale.AAC.1
MLPPIALQLDPRWPRAETVGAPHLGPGGYTVRAAITERRVAGVFRFEKWVGGAAACLLACLLAV